MRKVAGSPVHCRGQGFSPKGDKERFVLPADIRRIVTEASGNLNEMLVARDAEWTCLIACGTSYLDQLAEEILAERAAALANGQPAHRSKRQLLFGSFAQVNFDNSGRFILPAPMKQRVNIVDGIYIHGAMDYFHIWAPDELYKMEGPEWDDLKDDYAAQMAAASSRGRK